MLPAFVPCPCISKVSLKLLCYAGALLLALCKKPSTKMADALANHHERETARCHDLYKQINKANIYIYKSNALQTAGLYPNALEALTAKSSQQPAFRVLPKHDKAKVPFPSNH